MERSRIVTTEEKTKPVTDLFDQAAKNCEQMMKGSLKLQEETTKWWTNLYNQAAAPQDLQKKFKATADDIIPQAQKSLDECLKLVEQNSKAGIDLLKKAVATTQATSLEDAQTRTLRFWEASLSAVRDMTESVTQAHSKAIESWVDFVRKATEPTSAATKA
jgi:hypothetical protein